MWKLSIDHGGGSSSSNQNIYFIFYYFHYYVWKLLLIYVLSLLQSWDLDSKMNFIKRLDLHDEYKGTEPAASQLSLSWFSIKTGNREEQLTLLCQKLILGVKVQTIPLKALLKTPVFTYFSWLVSAL